MGLLESPRWGLANASIIFLKLLTMCILQMIWCSFSRVPEYRTVGSHSRAHPLVGDHPGQLSRSPGMFPSRPLSCPWTRWAGWVGGTSCVCSLCKGPGPGAVGCHFHHISTCLLPSIRQLGSGTLLLRLLILGLRGGACWLFNAHKIQF